MCVARGHHYQVSSVVSSSYSIHRTTSIYPDLLFHNFKISVIPKNDNQICRIYRPRNNIDTVHSFQSRWWYNFNIGSQQYSIRKQHGGKKIVKIKVPNRNQEPSIDSGKIDQRRVLQKVKVCTDRHGHENHNSDHFWIYILGFHSSNGFPW